jgi:uncharacterized protein YjeT (DUF2065 family)
MEAFVKAIGILMVVVGVLIVVRPSTARGFINYAKVGKRVLYAAVLRIIVGVLLLASIPYVAWPWVVGVVGGIGFASGVTIFVIGVERCHRLLDRFVMFADKIIRGYAMLAVAIGVLLIYAA